MGSPKKAAPAAQITAMVPNNDMGMAKSTFTVAENDPKKSQQTNEVSNTARTSSVSISCTDSSMNTVVSNRTSISIPWGRVLRSPGRGVA